jgi:arginine exporter protein ArgO
VRTVTGPILSGLVAGYALALPIGAIAALMVSLAAHTSLRVGVAAALGIATADGTYAVAAVLGGAAAANVIEPFTVPLRCVAALILAALATRIAITAIRHQREQDARPLYRGVLTKPAGAYVAFLGMTLLNPFTIIYFTSLVVSRQDKIGTNPATAGAYIAAIFAASASWFLLLAVSGAMLGRFITGRRGQVVTGLVSSLVIGVLAANVLLSTG